MRRKYADAQCFEIDNLNLALAASRNHQFLVAEAAQSEFVRRRFVHTYAMLCSILVRLSVKLIEHNTTLEDHTKVVHRRTCSDWDHIVLDLECF